MDYRKEDGAAIGRTVDAVLADEATIERCREYFDPEGSYAAADFNTLGENPPEEVCPDDLLAVSLLEVAFPPRAVRRILQQTDLRGTISAGLREVPVSLPLWAAYSHHIEALRRVWTALDELSGVGWVRTNKLLARKRPRLWPVYDSVVASAFGWPRPLIEPLAAVLSADSRRRVNDLERLHGTLDLPAEVPLLRTLDVGVWMAR